MNIKTAIQAIVCGTILLSGCANSLKEGLVLHSDFETDARDLSGNGRDGTLFGATLSDDSAVGNGSVYFDGNGSYVEYPEAVYFDGDYSISIWVKWEECKLWDRIMDFNQDKPMSGNAVTWLIGRPAQGTMNNLWFDQWVQYEGKAVESILDQRSTPADAYLEHNVETGKWEHYVIVYDSSKDNPHGVQTNTKGENVPLEGVVDLYVNGKLVGHNTHCLKPQHVETVANWLGRSRFAPDPYFKGWMDDFRIYNRCLSSKEILSLHDLNTLHNIKTK